ncbi:GGDEF domain-containing protein [Pseudoalteromonas sp. MMG010]|uniref:GGDEF domain-containing protein n=1 Tax=Pseudoalteromonas sp. MMG010 TaxID=2822685 RepID=UPI001B3A7082|nr:GGDEF domain-containing protein [Pseudoalteromonas sp. MMG010]MBQ4833695.1 GGDEF domain-containing protein [Pseudoalteromonas sp. MMG010]
MDIAALSSTKSLRLGVLKWMSLCFGVLSTIFALLNFFFNQFYVLGFVEAVFSSYCLYTYLCVKRGSVKPIQAIIVCTLLTMIVIFGTYITHPNNGLFVWVIVMPVIFYLILGKHYGVILSAFLLCSQLIVLSQKIDTSLLSSVNLRLNLLFAYISIWAVSHVFETSRAQFSKRLRKLAMLDPLTAAGNRLSMNHHFEVELTEKSNLYMILIDLDYFKQVNDKYGHDVGDQVLIEIATMFKVAMPKGFVFRVGGEEFAILSQFDSFDIAIKAVEKLREKIELTPISIDDKNINITVSLGVAQYQSKFDLKEFMNAADEQLYKAKHFGRNQVYYDSTEQNTDISQLAC